MALMTHFLLHKTTPGEGRKIKQIFHFAFVLLSGGGFHLIFGIFALLLSIHHRFRLFPAAVAMRER